MNKVATGYVATQYDGSIRCLRQKRRPWSKKIDQPVLTFSSTEILLFRRRSRYKLLDGGGNHGGLGVLDQKQLILYG